MLDLDKEFELIKKAHIAKTCFMYELANVREEVENSKGVNIPMFLLNDQMAQEAQNRVIANVASAEYGELMQYYNKAYNILAQVD